MVRQISFRIFTVIAWLRSAGVAASGKSVSHTRRPGIHSVLSTVQDSGPHWRRNRHDTPIHSISDAESVPSRGFPPVLRVRPFEALVWLRRSPRGHGFSHSDQGSVSWSHFRFAELRWETVRGLVSGATDSTPLLKPSWVLQPATQSRRRAQAPQQRVG